MAVVSTGITLSYKQTGEFIALTNLQEIPELGGTAESIEITTLADKAHMYCDGILNYGDSLAFKFLYETAQFETLAALEGSTEWQVALPDGTTCSFSGTSSIKLDGVGVNTVLTYTLAIKPNSEMVWG